MDYGLRNENRIIKEVEKKLGIDLQESGLHPCKDEK